MPLPALIEILPPPHAAAAEIAVPGSKSITNRALLRAAIADHPILLRGALWSEDTEAMADCLRRLGCRLKIDVDPREECNRSIQIEPSIHPLLCSGGTPEQPLELQVRNAGNAARFIAALVCLGNGCYRISGTPRMHERPQSGLFAALRRLGYRIDAENDRLPAVVHGAGPRPGSRCSVDIRESSQFASALLLVADRGGWDVAIQGGGDESSYVDMTAAVVHQLREAHEFAVEPDASSASYVWGAAWLLENSRIRVSPWMPQSLQIDARFPGLMQNFPPVVSRRTDLADSIMTAIVLAPFAVEDIAAKTFIDLGRLRLQECERVQALKTELTRCGAVVTEEGDRLKVVPSPLHGAEIETYEDHRMAMCFAMLGLKVPGMRIRNPNCVKKTFPDFFGKLVQLGATIRDEKGRTLNGNALLAD